MATCTYNCLMNVINIGNSIIGVSILAMPYCFRKCGILLSLVLIFISGILTRLACYLLLKSAIMARRRNFEFLAFHTFGSTGKLAVEISVIGFLIGVCIAFFVVIGDLGPPLVAEFLNVENAPNMRSNVLVLVGVGVALPLGMLRKIDSLTSLSALSIAFYLCLILKIFAEAVPNLAANEWMYEVNWWQSEGLLPCLPIFSMALSCQTQLFEFFDPMNDPSLKRMQSVVSGAVHLCSLVYIMVGMFGYIAFYKENITGNILILLTPSAVTEFIKLGFILTVAVSFPLCLFPCRSSLHSLLFKQGFGHHDINVNIIPDHRFRILTVSLVIITIGIAIMLPNIEFVLGFIGSTIGTLICLIFPAIMFIHDTSKNTTEKRMAQILMGIGIFILVACTYSTLQESSSHPVPLANQGQNMLKITPSPLQIMSSLPTIAKESPAVQLKNEVKNLDEKKKEITPDLKLSGDQKRLEPPIPQDPDVKADQNADLDPQALQNEDKELQKEMNPPSASSTSLLSKKDKDLDKQEKLLQQLEEQHKEQKLILEQQKKVLEELKLHKESHEEQRKINLEEKQKLESKISAPSNQQQDLLPENMNDKHAREPLQNLPLENNVQQIAIVKTNFKSEPLKISKNSSAETPVEQNLIIKMHKEKLKDKSFTGDKNVILKHKQLHNKSGFNETFHNIIPETHKKNFVNVSISIQQNINPVAKLSSSTKEPPELNNAVQESLKNPNTHIKQRETLEKKSVNNGPSILTKKEVPESNVIADNLNHR